MDITRRSFYYDQQSVTRRVYCYMEMKKKSLHKKRTTVTVTHNRNTFILINKNKTKLYKERLLKNNHLQMRWTVIK